MQTLKPVIRRERVYINCAGAAPSRGDACRCKVVVSFPDPDPHAGKGLVTFAQFVGCARSAIA